MLEYSMKSTSNSKVGDVTSFLVLHSPLDVQINLQIKYFFFKLGWKFKRQVKYLSY